MRACVGVHACLSACVRAYVCACMVCLCRILPELLMCDGSMIIEKLVEFFLI